MGQRIMSATELLATEAVVEPTRKRGSRLKRLLRNRKLAVGGGIVAFFVLLGLVGPLLAGDPDQVSDDMMAAPSLAHLLGTTNTGQDVFSQVLVGTRGSLLIGLLVGIAATVVSIVVGVGGGYVGGKADEGLSLLSNVFLVIPGLPLIILITDYVHTRGILTIAVVIAITGWAGAARVLRAQTMSLRNRDYVDAARVAGEPVWRLIGFEILPNLAPIIASQFVFAVIGGILTEAGLSFLGLGNGSTDSWGSMLYFAQNAQALQLGAWWWFVPPGLCIAIIGAGLSLINFSIDEIVNPRLRIRRAKVGPARKGARP